MISYLPEIYPDELVYSWFCRYVVHSGYISHKQVLQDLFCKKSDTPIKEFIGNLNPTARECIDKMYPLRELVLNHTMYPQYARFIPLEQKRDALDKLCYENCDVHQLFAVPPRCEKERYLKYCPVCAKEDRQNYGETYWHRKHQIRNISVCTKHRCQLRDSGVTAKSMSIYTFSAAELEIPNMEEFIPATNLLQLEFAEYMEQIFDAPIDFEKDIPIHAILYYGIKDTEYMTSTGTCRYMKKFVSDLTDYYKKLELNEIASIHQIQRMLLSGERHDFSLACQIGFFLNMIPEELADSQLSEEQIRQEEESHYIKRNKAPDWEQYDTDTGHIMEKVASDIYSGAADDIGKPGKVTEKSICKILDIKQHQLEHMPKCRAILERYAETYPEFWARKLVWGYKVLRQEQDIIYWSDLRKITGVKKERINEILPYLVEVAGSDFVAIVEIIKD